MKEARSHARELQLRTSAQQLKRMNLARFDQIDENMRERLKWSDIKLLRSLLIFLEMRSWAKRSRATVTDNDNEDEVDDDDDCSLAEIKESVEYIATHFRLPLEVKGVSLATLQDEIKEAVEYARTYLDINRTGYRKV